MSLIVTYLRARARSFYHAGAGLGRLVREERNAQIHLVATIVVVAFGVWVHLSAAEWSAIVLCITMVWAAEAANSAVERVADAASKEHHPLVGAAKDLAAGAVLVTALGAVVVGCLVLGPHVVR
jgi:diacylglycerol kinase